MIPNCFFFQVARLHLLKGSHTQHKRGERVTPGLPRVKGQSSGPHQPSFRSTKQSFTLPHRLGIKQWLSGRTTEADGRKSSLGEHSGRLGKGGDPQAGPEFGFVGCPDDTAEPRPRPGPESAHPLPDTIFPPQPYRPVVLRPGEKHGKGRRKRQWLLRDS